MTTESKGKKKKKIKYRDICNKAMGFQRFVNSFINSFAGLQYAYTHEQSLLIHIFLTIVAVATGIFFGISGTQWVLLLFAMALIIVTELLNTAIEAVVDLVTEDYHPLAKVAKDCASAAVFVVSLMATCIWIYVFVPQIIKLFF